MRVAVIDLGTNTFNLLIADISSDKHFEVIYNKKTVVKIGEGALIEGRLLPAPRQRGMMALTEQLRVIREHQCGKTFAFATSGIRSTSNGADFVQQVKDELGLTINVIDGDEEARLIYDGVHLAVPNIAEPALIMDIGGGSTEFIIADQHGVLWKRSYRLGISRILQLLEPQDPLTSNDLNRLSELLQVKLTDLIRECTERNVKLLIGSSGSFDSFIEMLWAGKDIRRTTRDIVSENIDADELKVLNARLVSMNEEARRNVPGLVEMRVDTIHLASYFVQWALRECMLDRILLSTYALKEGVLHRMMQNRL